MASGPFRRGGNIFVIFTLTRNECFCAITHLLTRDSLMKKASEKLLLQLLVFDRYHFTDTDTDTD